MSDLNETTYPIKEKINSWFKTNFSKTEQKDIIKTINNFSNYVNYKLNELDQLIITNKIGKN